ncbi:MAG: hypothetical protein FJ125_12685 [Deltaproteobacteria bacterium]|nr:hypothetical protein [Deltaproteobacteria bacterium]
MRGATRRAERIPAATAQVARAGGSSRGDAGVFFRSYCELLREVWSAPLRWEGGPRPGPPPLGHVCAGPGD